jgi:hypothetical protein
MSDWTITLLVLPGFFVGTLVWSRLAHLLQAILGIDGETKAGEDEGPAWTRNQILAVIAWVAGWLAVFGGLAYYFFDLHGRPSGWFWFFVGVTATPGVILPPALIFLFRHQRRTAEYTAELESAPPSSAEFVYEITFDEPYIRTMIDRYLRQLPMGGSIKAGFVLLAGVAAVIWIIDPFGGDAALIASLILIVGVPALFVAHRMSRRLMFSDFGYASHMGKSSAYELSAAGLEVEGHRPWHRVLWPDLIKWPDLWIATRFSDGFFLFGGGAMAWLPDAALVDATPQQVGCFISERMRLRIQK